MEGRWAASGNDLVGAVTLPAVFHEGVMQWELYHSDHSVVMVMVMAIAVAVRWTYITSGSRWM